MRVLFSALSSGLAAAVVAASIGAARLPKPPSLPAGWSHASINVVVKRVPHTYTYDHGRVVAASPTALTLREPDGSVVTIGLDSSTVVRIAGRPATIDQIRRLEMVTTVTVDGGAAALVQVQLLRSLAAALAAGVR